MLLKLAELPEADIRKKLIVAPCLLSGSAALDMAGAISQLSGTRAPRMFFRLAACVCFVIVHLPIISPVSMFFSSLCTLLHITGSLVFL